MVHTHPIAGKFQVIPFNFYIQMVHTHPFTDNSQQIASNPYIPLYSSHTFFHEQIPSNSI